MQRQHTFYLTEGADAEAGELQQELDKFDSSLVLGLKILLPEATPVMPRDLLVTTSW